MTRLQSYVSDDGRKSFCVYEAPTPEAIRKTAARNVLPVEEALRRWVRQAEADSGRRRDLLTSEEREELKRLCKENFELRRANAILKDASVSFAQELDPSRGR